MNKYTQIRQAAYDGNMQLPALGLVIFTFGNVSAGDHDLGVFAIKPSGVPYEDLTPEKMIVVDFDAKIVEGNLRPSSDTKTHVHKRDCLDKTISLLIEPSFEAGMCYSETL